MQAAPLKMSGLFVVLLCLAACGPEQGAGGGTPPDPANASGLEERLPDTCKLANYQSLVGQRLSALVLPVGVDTRIVRPDAILTQEYVSSRVNFHVNEAGFVTKVICG